MISNSTKAKFSLGSINLSFKAGQLTIITGKVGSGKSSLLLACLNEIYNHSGSISMVGSIAYVPQEAFLMNGTIKENILFGKKFIKEKYENCLICCELMQDLKNFPERDLTEVGERAFNLSGGQKQRISLARALYSDMDIFLIDSVLSALDAETGQKVFKNLILGELKYKTVLMVTHASQFLPKADQIVILNKGEIFFKGKFDNLVKEKNLEKFLSKETIKGFKESLNSEEKIIEIGNLSPEILSLQISKKGNFSFIKEDKLEELRMVLEPENTLNYTLPDFEQSAQTKSLFYQNFRFIKSVGIFNFTFSILLILNSLLCCILLQVVLASWVSASNSAPKLQYVISSGCLCLIMLISCGVFVKIYPSFVTKALYNLYSKMCQNLFRRKMVFFDRNKLGSILNRCHGDVVEMDDGVGQLSIFIYYSIVQIVLVLVLSSLASPAMLIVYIVIFCIGRRVFYIFTTSNLHFNKKAQIAQGELASSLLEASNGAGVARAYKQQQLLARRFKKKLKELIDCFYLKEFLQVWICLKMEYVLAMLILGSSFSFVLGKFYSVGLFDNKEVVSVVLTWVISLGTTLNLNFFPIKKFVEGLTNLQRVFEYIDWEEQEPEPSAPVPVLERWPRSGQLIVENLAMRYRKSLPMVLKGISFEVKSGEKVGIVGRTGSGKSSLILGLLRIVEPEKAYNEKKCRICLDGEDLLNLGLNFVRKELVLIPQDPTLISGSLKDNLDVDGIFTDEELIEVMEWTGLDSSLTIKNIKKKNSKEKNLNEKINKEKNSKYNSYIENSNKMKKLSNINIEENSIEQNLYENGKKYFNER